MDWFVLTLVSFGAVTLVSSFRVPSLDLLPPEQKHVPPLSALSFQRDSVEKVPDVRTKLTDQLEYGSKSLPLRDAVESLPNVIGATHQPLRDAVEAIPEEIGERVPLRDAVEFRVAPSFGGLDRGSFWIEQLAPPAIRRTHNSPSVVCHLEARAVYRTEPFALLPQAVPSHKCTHLIYSAATLDPHELVLMSRDPEYDEVKGGYRAAVGLRQRHPALRVLISIASPDHGRLYRELLHGYDCCQRFVQSVLEFLEIHQFDGVEIDWEDVSGTEMRLLLRELYAALNDRGYTIAVAIRPEDPVDPEIATMADLLLLRAWRNNEDDEVTRHLAPLNFVSNLVKKWTDSGVPASKIILGVPLFGRSYTLKFNNATDAGVPVVGPGLEGLYTKHRGTLAYYEICEKLEDLWISGRDDEGPYLKRGDQWIGYDDPISMKIKVAYLRSAGLGGVSLWAIDLDDFQGLCGDAWPMLNAATTALGLYDVSSKKCYEEGLFGDPNSCSGYLSCIKGELYYGNCGFERFFDSAKGRCVMATPEICNPGHAVRISSIDATFNQLRRSQELEKLEVRENGPRVVCYITSWALYRKGEGKFVPEHLDTRLCTDVVYAFAGLNPNTLLVQPFDPWADIENNLYQRVTSIKGPRVILALGGWTDSSGDKYSRLVSSSSSRRKFVAATVSFLRKHNFDGLSLEWNYPHCWQSDCKRGSETDKPNFMKLILELRDEFDRQEPKLLLAVAISGYKEVIDRAYQLRELSDAVDYISVMSYDYHGAWESTTAHLAPLYAESGDSNPYYNVNFTMEYLVSLGASRSKLLTGVPFYGQTYRLSDASHSDPRDPSAGPGIPGEFTRQPGMLAYYEICDRIKMQRWQTGPGPNAHFKDQWVGYEDTKSIFKKGKYILQNGFGGATAWTVDLDDFTNHCCFEPFPLLRSLNRALGRLLTAEPSSGDCQKPAEPITPQPPTLTTPGDALDGKPKPTRPMITDITSEATSWPMWTEKPSKIPGSTTTPTSTTWSWTTSRRPAQSTITTTEQSGGSSTSGISTPVPGMACSIGQYMADPSNCGNYFRCVLGELKREQCAPGLHWDVKRGLCDWPSSAKCHSKTELSPSTSKPWQPPRRTTTMKPFSILSSWNYDVTTQRPHVSSISTSSKPTEKPEVINRCEHGQYYALPSSCTSFLVCVNGNLVAQQCGPGLNWSKEKNMCDWAFKNPCTEHPKKTAPLVMNDMVTDICIPGSYTDVEGDCESYKACLWGRHEIFQCAPGLHFNKETRICDWPSRANCKDDNAGSSTSAPTAGTYPTRPTIKPVETTTTEKPWTQGSVLPSAEVDPAKVSPLSGHFKVVCYFTNWAWYRRGVGRYLPEHIDHTLCTHIIYGFAVLDYSNLIIKAHDSWADFDNRFYERVVAYKQRGLKVLLALGGWNDSAGDKYSRLVNNPSARKKFIEHVVQFVEKFGFDGLDLDWEYPVCWQVDCKKGPESDKEGFALLLKELSSELKPRGLLLSAAVSPSKKVIDTGYDVPALAKYLDWISVMTYDFHGQWDKRTGHVAPLYYHPDDEFFYFNANYSINYWISKGAPPRNIVMGMPLYGQSFTINDPKSGTGLNSPASAGNTGEFTRAAGFLAYYEICDRIRNHGWTVVQDSQRRLGPYAYKGSQWVSFDDSDMIRQKAQYVRDMGLGGGMVWALDLDDFRGRCNEGPHPLMHTLQQVLSEPPNKHDRPIKPPFFGQELEWKLPTPPDTTAPLMTQFMDHSVKDNEEFKVICYFTNWAWYRQEGGRFVPEDIDPDLCSHVIYGFAVLDTTSLTIKSHDPWADIDNKFYERVVAFKSKGIKVILAIGGWNDSAGNKYSRLVNSSASRRRFITHVLQFIEKYNFDGLDLDWEYPVCWQVDCKRGPSSDKKGFSMLVKELSAEFKPKGLLLSSAVSPNKRVIDEGYDVPFLAKYLDWIAVMAYDYHGQWDKKTGHVAPLYVHPDDWETTFNANFSIHYWLEQGAPPKKLVMGAPLYGQSFTLAERSERGLNAPTYGGGEAGESTRARGFLSYYEICERVLKQSWTVVQDPKRRIGPYAYKGDQWVSFDDVEQIKIKTQFIKDLGLGGGMVWALDLDDFKNRCGCEPSPLLRTMNRVLRNYPGGSTCSITGSSIVAPAPTIPTEKPTYHPTQPSKPSTTPRPTYLPPVVTTPDPEDSIEVDAGSPPAPITPIGDCAGRMYTPHKKDCTKYFLCNFGQLSEQTCPGGLYWNKDRCDWPENSDCSNRLEQMEPIVPGKPELPTATGKPCISSNLRTIDGGSHLKNKKLVCYFTNWAWYRPGIGKYLPEDIDPNHCTHVVYGFTVLDSEQLIMKIHDSWTDIDNDFYGKVTALKAKGIKVLIALGGWNDSAEDKLKNSRLMNNPIARKNFITHALEFIEEYGFDGLDLDWEYPVCWHVDCNRGLSSDKEAFASLVKELSIKFKPRGLLLSSVVSSSKKVIDIGYDVPTLAKYLDWIAVMTYDFHGHWEQKTGHVAPLFYYPGDEFDHFNANFSMNYWIEKGAPPSSLVMGIPLYGQSFTLQNATVRNLQAETSGPGQAGEFTRAAGFLAFYEICDKVKNGGWTVTKDPISRVGPFATKGDQWVGYDDVTNVVKKATLIRDLNLGGGMVWALDLDDFKNLCGCGKYPLLTALSRVLSGEQVYSRDCI